MILRMSTMFLRTLREDPADAEVPSHKWLVRAGYVRRAAPGVFTWLPLGNLLLRRIERIIHEEMQAIGGQEVHFPALLPREPYEATGRWNEYGPTLFRLKDRKGADYLLGPTHEEMFTLLVKDLYRSYKDLPLTLYQVQTKYRDEARPRAGVLRGREFSMKDSYSFAIDDEGLASAYADHRAAYARIFERLGIDFVVVSAVSGAMGGSASEEFLAPCAIGEDTFAQCDTCDYAANTEAVTVRVDPAPAADHGPATDVATPRAGAIGDVVDLLNRTTPRADGRPWAAGDMLKNVVVRCVQPDGTFEPLVIGVPGDREVDEKRLEAALAPATVEPFTEEDFTRHPGLVKGFIGPGVLGAKGPLGLRYLTDPRVQSGTAWVSGANRADVHTTDLVVGRDFASDGTIDVASILDGDRCPACDGTLRLTRGVEIGHIFQLGRKYADALDLQVQDERGALVTVTMGSYGIGVSRAMAVIAEQSCDDRGLCWPASVSPADVHIVAAGKDATIAAGAEQLATELAAAGLDVLLDDRKAVSPGVKFNDSELIGVPTILVVGRGLTRGVVEVKDRRTGERTEIPVGEAAAAVLARVRGA